MEITVLPSPSAVRIFTKLANLAVFAFPDTSAACPVIERVRLLVDRWNHRGTVALLANVWRTGERSAMAEAQLLIAPTRVGAKEVDK